MLQFDSTEFLNEEIKCHFCTFVLFKWSHCALPPLLVQRGFTPQNHKILSCKLVMLNSRGLLSILNISLISELKQVSEVFSGPFPLCFRDIFWHAAPFLPTAGIQTKPFHEKSHLSEMRNASRHVLATVHVFKVYRHYYTIQLHSYGYQAFFQKLGLELAQRCAPNFCEYI